MTTETRRTITVKGADWIITCPEEDVNELRPDVWETFYKGVERCFEPNEWRVWGQQRNAAHILSFAERQGFEVTEEARALVAQVMTQPRRRRNE